MFHEGKERIEKDFSVIQILNDLDNIKIITEE